MRLAKVWRRSWKRMSGSSVRLRVGEHVLGDVDYALDGHERQREGRVHQRPAEIPLRREVMIEVYGGRVSREQGELEVVRGGHGAPQRVLLDVADLETLEEPASPTLFRRHFP